MIHDREGMSRVFGEVNAFVMADSLICRTLINSVREAKDVVQEGMSDSNQTPPSHHHTITPTHATFAHNSKRDKRGFSVLLVHSMTVKRKHVLSNQKKELLNHKAFCPCCPTFGFEPFFFVQELLRNRFSVFDSALERNQRESQTFHFR